MLNIKYYYFLSDLDTSSVSGFAASRECNSLLMLFGEIQIRSGQSPKSYNFLIEPFSAAQNCAIEI